MQLILASRSTARAQLLRAAGYRFTQHPAAVSEPSASPRSRLRAHALKLARMKAEAVAARYPRAFVIGADTALACDGRIFGKPADLAEAVRMLRRLAGRTHRICSAICVVAPADGASQRRILTAADTARVTLRKWTPQRLARHVAQTRPVRWAGAYALQEEGSAAIVLAIKGDPATVIGLPLTLVDRLLRKAGFLR
jgi:septum formation protein